jgi:hypothetical protein
MERIGQILRALFCRALSEVGQEAPALTDIMIESAVGRSEPRLGAQFSNGYRTWTALRPSDCYAVCERHSAWDLEGLRRAILNEAHRIYSQMLQEHIAERRLGERDRRTQFTEQLRRLGRELARSFRPQWESPFFVRRGRSLFADECSREAQGRGIQLLKENLSPAQLKQYEKHGYFDVIGGRSRKRYRIRHGRAMNIDQLDKNGRRVCGWCFYPQGCLVAGDVMLAQKTALELFEAEALKIANKF